MVHLGPLWHPMQLPWPLPKSAAPAVTSAATRLVGARGDRTVAIQLAMSDQFVGSAPCAAMAVLDPWSPCCVGVWLSVLIRSDVAGVHVNDLGSHTPLEHTVWSVTEHAVLATDTIAPTPPEMPRTLPSKSAISSLMALQLRMR